MKSVKPVIIIVGILLVVGSIIGGLVTVNTVSKEMNKHEQELNVAFANAQNVHSSMTNKALSAMGIQKESSKSAKAIIDDAIRGRYEGKMAPGTGGSMYSAITEAYPDTKGDSAGYAQVMRIVETGRSQFEAAQANLNSRIGAYNVWRNNGIFHSWVVDQVGSPSSNLEVRIDGKVLTGKEAFEAMKTLLLSSQTQEAYKTGEDKALFTE